MHPGSPVVGLVPTFLVSKEPSEMSFTASSTSASPLAANIAKPVIASPTPQPKGPAAHEIYRTS
jgi:hypothetical protein